MLWLTPLLLAAAPLSLEQALAHAEQAPSVVAAQRATADFQRTAARLSAVVTSPTVGLQTGVRNVPATGPGPELYLSASQPVLLAPLAAQRTAAVAAEQAALERHVEERRRDARLRTAQAWFAAWLAQRRLALADAERDAAEDAHARMARAQQAGALTQDELAVAAAYLAEAELSVLRAEGDRFLAGVALARTVGAPQTEPQELPQALPPVPRPADGWVAQASPPPSVVAAAARLEAERARVPEARAGKASALQLGLTGGREGGGDLVGLVTAQLTLGSLDSNAREEAPLHAAVASAEGALAEARLDVDAARAAAAHEVLHSEEVLQVVEGRLVPAAQRAFDATAARYGRGAATVHDWVLARRSWLAAQAQHLAAQADFRHACFVALELGAPTP